MGGRKAILRYAFFFSDICTYIQKNSTGIGNHQLKAGIVSSTNVFLLSSADSAIRTAISTAVKGNTSTIPNPTIHSIQAIHS